MSDLIRRSDVIRAVEEAFDMGDCYCDRYGIRGAINSIPSADRPQGEWIEVEEDWRHQIEFWKCSECDFAVSSRYNFCPNCGCRMKGADDD